MVLNKSTTFPQAEDRQDLRPILMHLYKVSTHWLISQMILTKNIFTHTLTPQMILSKML